MTFLLLMFANSRDTRMSGVYPRLCLLVMQRSIRVRVQARLVVTSGRVAGWDLSRPAPVFRIDDTADKFGVFHHVRRR